MKRFHHTRDNRIIVSNGENEFALPLDDFLLNVPNYPGLPSGFVERYLTDEKHYLTASNFEQIPQEPLPEAQEWINVCIQKELEKIQIIEQAQAQRENRYQAYNSALSQGWKIPGTQIILSVSDWSRANFDALANHLKRKFEDNQITLETMIAVPDKEKDWHQISYDTFCKMIIPFGDRCFEVYNMNPDNK